MKQRNELEKIMFHPTGSDLKPYEWMIQPTRQQEWIDDKGIFLWLAFFFSEIGAGLYFVSLFYEYKAGLILGWLVTLILGGVIHVLYLGNPLRAWRMLMKPNTSELSRGIWIIGAFAALGFLQIVTAGGFNIVFNHYECHQSTSGLELNNGSAIVRYFRGMDRPPDFAVHVCCFRVCDACIRNGSMGGGIFLCLFSLHSALCLGNFS